MKKILVTGATGTLGREVVDQLSNQNHQVSILSSQQNPSFHNGIHVFKGNLATNIGLCEATKNEEIIIHCASNPKESSKTDIQGIHNLLNTIDKNKTHHLIYISIVGVDKSSYPYYKAKNNVEKIIIESGMPYSILRTTQFHNLVFNIIQSFTKDSKMGIMQIPQGMRFQPIEVKEVANQLIKLAESKPVGLLPDFGGAKVLTIEEMAQVYLDIFERKEILQPIPFEDERYNLFRSGINLCPANICGHTTWEEFLRNQLLVASDFINKQRGN